MSQEQQILFEKLSQMAIKSFARRHLTAHYVLNKAAAVSKILELVPEGASVGAGESVTLNQIGIFSALSKRCKNEVIYPFERDAQGYLMISQLQSDEMMRKAMLADVFLSGTNALTLDGKLVNMDGLGNRVAPLFFGPRKVIIVVSANKIVKDVDAALERIKRVCAPLNSLRHGMQHHDTEFLELPCAKTGVCVDCSKPQRMCNFISIIEGESHWTAGRLNILIVGEQLGI
ncbi:MAG: lactate utilization protein [Dehalococcoidales bacterium]|nr:lactate utilization protein [Dehalococcoidales bacterium]